MPKLTKRLIDALQTDDAEAFVWDTIVLGFGVRVRRSGTKSFILKYRMGSAVRRHTLGRVGSPHTVEEARDAASEMLRQVKAGHDPMQAKRASNEAITVNELIQAYLHEGRIAKPNKRESSWAGDTSVLNRHVSPLLGHRLARDLTRRDLEKLQADVLTGKTAKDVRTKSRGRAIIRGGPGAVVVLSRHPLQRRAHVGRDLVHEPAREGLQVGEVAPVLRIDDDPEVMPIPFAAPREAGRVHRILARIEETTLLTFDPSPLAGHIADMGHQRFFRARRHRHDPHLDHHPTHSARR